MPLDVRINGLGGNLATIRGDQGWIFRDLKAAVRKELKIGSNCFKLFNGRTEILSTQFIRDLPDDTVVELSLIFQKVDRGDIIGRVRLECEKAIQMLALHPCLRADRVFVRDAIKKGVPILEYAIPKLKADRDLVLEAARTCPCSLRYAASELKVDRDFVLTAIGYAI